MNIRRATLEDVPQIVGIYAKDAIIGAREEVLPAIPEAYRTAFAAIDRDPNQVLLVAEDEGIVVGTVQVTAIQYLLFRAERIAVIEAVFVDANHQGQGVGQHLMAAAEDWARKNGCLEVELTSNKQRPRAHAFYKKLGYVDSHEGFKKKLTGPK